MIKSPPADQFSPYLLFLLVIVVCTLAAGCPNRETNSTTTKTLVPRLKIERTSLDAGETDFSVLTEGKFPIRNAGDGALTLKLISKSCLCSEVVVPWEIAPGKEGTVVLRWTPTLTQVGSVRVTCELQTNDPAMPTLNLEMRGTVDPLIRLWPENVGTLNFGHFHPGEKKRRELKVFSTKLAAFELDAKLSMSGIKVSRHELNAKDRIGELQPKCAYALILETRPDLSLGFFDKQLELTVKLLDGSVRTLSIWVSGAVVDRLFNVLPQEIAFSRANLADGDAQKVRVQFIDPNAKQKLKIVTWEPAFLQCDGPVTLPGAPGLWEFVVRIPANIPDAAKIQAKGSFEGKIVLEALGSEVQVPVPVRWAPLVDKR